MNIRGLLFAWVLLLGARLPAAEEDATPADTWRGRWSSRFAEAQAEWVLELPGRAGEVTGVLRSSETVWSVEGRREGAWLELSWKDASGRITQARGVVGEGQWRGLTLSGGDGHLVEYGRFVLRLAVAEDKPPAEHR